MAVLLCGLPLYFSFYGLTAITASIYTESIKGVSGPPSYVAQTTFAFSKKMWPQALQTTFMCGFSEQTSSSHLVSVLTTCDQVSRDAREAKMK